MYVLIFMILQLTPHFSLKNARLTSDIFDKQNQHSPQHVLFLATTSRICIHVPSYLSMNKNLKLNYLEICFEQQHTSFEKIKNERIFVCLFLGVFRREFLLIWRRHHYIGEGFHMTYTRHSWPFSSEGFLTCPSTVARAIPLHSHLRWQRWHQEMAEICHVTIDPTFSIGNMKTITVYMQNCKSWSAPFKIRQLVI